MQAKDLLKIMDLMQERVNLVQLKLDKIISDTNENHRKRLNQQRDWKNNIGIIDKNGYFRVKSK